MIETTPQTPPQEQAKPKRKREQRLKPLVDAPLEAASQPVETVAEKPKTTRKPRKKKFVVTKFDKTLARLIVRGERSASKIRDALRVDADEFENELARLTSEGLIVRGKFDSDYLSFTVKGFDSFASLFNKTLEKELATEAEASVVWDARQTLLKTEEEQKEKERKAESEKDALQRALSEDKALLSASLTENKKEIDLEDAFKKGAPNGTETIKPKEKNKVQTTKKIEPKLEVDAVTKNEVELRKTLEAEVAKTTRSAAQGAAMRVGENEVCELCRAPFKIGVGAARNHPKFGHCFCGAAYHKDCYESLATEQEGKCVRCGKKLKLAMDARSEEAVKELKNVF